MTSGNFYKAIVVALMVGLMMSLVFLVFSILEGTIGQIIAIASFAATTAIVFLHSSDHGSKPLTIFCAYLTAAVVGYGVSLIPIEQTVQVFVGLFLTVFLFLITQWMHPPAVAYSLTFLLGNFGLTEVFFTIPALFVYLVTLGVVVFCIERAAVLFGWLPADKDVPVPGTWYEYIEDRVHRLVPFSLILLFVAIAAEFLYPNVVEPYLFYIRIFDGFVIGLFVLDLTFIYRRSTSVRQFVQENWMDILATIPFFLVIRFFQGVSLVVALIARGTAGAVTEVASFVRFMRPLARTPRFARLLDRLESLDLQS